MKRSVRMAKQFLQGRHLTIREELDLQHGINILKSLSVDTEPKLTSFYNTWAGSVYNYKNQALPKEELLKHIEERFPKNNEDLRYSSVSMREIYIGKDPANVYLWFLRKMDNVPTHVAEIEYRVHGFRPAISSEISLSHA